MEPTDWRRVALAQCGTWFSGGTPSKSESTYWNGSIPWVSAKDMKGLRVYDSEDHVTLAGAARGTRLVPAGSVLVLTRGMTLHRDVPICLAMRELCFNQDVKAVIAGEGVSPDFLFYALLANKDRLLGLVDSASHGTGRIHSAGLVELRIVLPGLREQESIAAVLTALDDKCAMNRRVNKTLEETAAALFIGFFVDVDAISGDSRSGLVRGASDGMVPVYPYQYVDSAAGPLPKGWSVQPLGVVTDYLRRGISPTYVDNGGVVVINQKCVRDHRLNLDPARRHDASKRPIAGREVREGDVLVNSTGVGTLGRVARVSRLDVTTTADSHVTVIRANPSLLTSSVLAQTCFWREREIEALGEGSTGQTELNRERLATFPVLVPPMPIQQRFDALVKPMHSLMDNRERESRTLAELRDTLLPKLLNGELRAREAESSLEAAV
jgi:type I restriction enzyme, S subunit